MSKSDHALSALFVSAVFIFETPIFKCHSFFLHPDFCALLVCFFYVETVKKNLNLNSVLVWAARWRPCYCRTNAVLGSNVTKMNNNWWKIKLVEFALYWYMHKSIMGNAEFFFFFLLRLFPEMKSVGLCWQEGRWAAEWHRVTEIK